MSDLICGQPSVRILIGHSAAGCFTMNVFINDYKIFNHYLAIDPYIVGQDYYTKVSVTNDSSSHWEKSIFISIARTFPDSRTFDEMKSDTSERSIMVREILAPTESLQNKAEVDNFTYQYFDKESHMSVPNISIYHGIRFFFEGYKPVE